jgi:hypothetical protein
MASERDAQPSSERPGQAEALALITAIAEGAIPTIAWTREEAIAAAVQLASWAMLYPLYLDEGLGLGPLVHLQRVINGIEKPLMPVNIVDPPADPTHA